MARRPIVNIKLTRDPATGPTALQSWILSTASTYNDDQVLVFFSESEVPPDTGQAFSHIVPRDDETFEIDIGVALPSWLPNMDGKHEYAIDVARADGSVRTLCVSNQMIKLLYVRDGRQYQTILPRRLLNEVQDSQDMQLPADAPIAPLRTVVTSRFIIRGATAHAALEADIDTCIDELIECLNNMAVANVSVNERLFPGFVSPVYDKSSIGVAYFILRGAAPKRFANWLMVTAVSRASLRPTANFSSTEERVVREMLGGAGIVDDVTKLIQVGRAYIESGLLEFAFLQLVIAAEMATARFVHATLIAKGVSKTKVRELKTELTFSMMLNLDVVALAPASKKPDLALLGRINEARKRRNKLMHEGTFDATRDYLRELCDAVKSYAAYLDEIKPRSNL